MEKSAAVLTIFRAAEMTPQGRKDIAKWLDNQKKLLLKEGDSLSKRFTARYIFTDDTPDLEF